MDKDKSVSSCQGQLLAKLPVANFRGWYKTYAARMNRARADLPRILDFSPLGKQLEFDFLAAELKQRGF